MITFLGLLPFLALVLMPLLLCAGSLSYETERTLTRYATLMSLPGGLALAAVAYLSNNEPLQAAAGIAAGIVVFAVCRSVDDSQRQAGAAAAMTLGMLGVYLAAALSFSAIASGVLMIAVAAVYQRCVRLLDARLDAISQPRDPDPAAFPPKEPAPPAADVHTPAPPVAGPEVIAPALPPAPPAVDDAPAAETSYPWQQPAAPTPATPIPAPATPSPVPVPPSRPPLRPRDSSLLDRPAPPSVPHLPPVPPTADGDFSHRRRTGPLDRS